MLLPRAGSMVVRMLCFHNFMAGLCKRQLNQDSALLCLVLTMAFFVFQVRVLLFLRVWLFSAVDCLESTLLILQ